MSDTKKCGMCGEVKGLGEFGRNARAKDGKQTTCKSCNQIKCELWRKANPDKAKSARDAWRALHAEALKQYGVEYRIRNPEQSGAWRKANPEAYKAYKKQWRMNRIQTERERETLWKKANPDTVARVNKARITQISDGYAASLVKMHVADMPPELIALKREQLAIKRMARELKKAATKPTGENE